MISHDNITWSSRVLREQNLGFATCKERVISYLPLSHVSAQLLDIHIPMAIGAHIAKLCNLRMGLLFAISICIFVSCFCLVYVYNVIILLIVT